MDGSSGNHQICAVIEKHSLDSRLTCHFPLNSETQQSSLKLLIAVWGQRNEPRHHFVRHSCAIHRSLLGLHLIVLPSTAKGLLKLHCHPILPSEHELNRGVCYTIPLQYLHQQ